MAIGAILAIGIRVAVFAAGALARSGAFLGRGVGGLGRGLGRFGRRGRSRRDDDDGFGLDPGGGENSGDLRFRIKGLRELIGAFDDAAATCAAGFHDELADVMDRIRSDADARAQRFRGVAPFAGSASSNVAIVSPGAPSRGIRPDFGELLGRSSLFPAFDSQEGQVFGMFEEWLDDLVRDWER